GSLSPPRQVIPRLRCLDRHQRHSLRSQSHTHRRHRRRRNKSWPTWRVRLSKIIREGKAQLRASLRRELDGVARFGFATAVRHRNPVDPFGFKAVTWEAEKV